MCVLRDNDVTQALTYVFAGNDVAVEAIKFFVTKEVLVSNKVTPKHSCN